MKKLLLLSFCIAVTPAFAQKLAITELGRYTDGRKGALEIVSYDSASKQLFVTNAVTDSIDIVNIGTPSSPVRVSGIDITPYGDGVNSVVCLGNGYIAAAIEASPKQDSGSVVFFTTAGVYANRVKVGALPDMITVTKDGKKVLVAGEGEPSGDYTNDPEGTIGIIDISGGVPALTQSNVKLLTFHAAPSGISGSLRKPATSWAKDIEPEYIAVNEASTLAAVACQEANMFVMVDLAADTILQYKGLGFKDHSLAGKGLDASDKDNKIDIQNWPVKGVYMPDATAAYTVGGNTYFVTANEGDARDYDAYVNETRIKSLTLDVTVFSTASALQKDAALGRLKCLTPDVIGDPDADGDVDEIYTFGARSFSVWDKDGNLVWDSGDDFEQFIKANHPSFFNCDEGDSTKKDTRSDDKGAEPEALTIGKLGSRFYAFIGLERQGGIMVYDITVPAAPVFETFISPFKADGTSVDVAPEGLIFVPAANSHTGKNLLIASHEVSGTTTIFQIDDLLTSIDESVLYAGHMSLYPNPTGDFLHIRITNALTNCEMQVYNILGQQIKQVALTGEDTELRVSDMPSGVYSVRVVDRQGRSVVPSALFMKQ